MARIGVIGLLLAALVGGCAYNGLQFVRDDRLQIVGPRENERVRIPFTVDWKLKGYTGRVGVFFDRAPMATKKGLLSLVGRNDPCRRRSDCPDTTWLSQHGVYVVDRAPLRVDFLEDLRASHNVADRHTMSIVLLDGANRRVGEATFVREFIVDRKV
ncbi:MAG: hypothetical protein QOI47_2049 [Actinomycetota bacterium]|jgi:hypothetical protein|nr:hypothetical protein [Actinomycetota bacterium]